MKRNTSKRLSILTIGTLVSIGLFAQSYGSNRYLLSHYDITHEVSVWAAGAYTPTQFTKNRGISSGLIRPAFGIGYTYWFHPQVGVGIGAEYAQYASLMKNTKLEDKYVDNNNIQFVSNIERYEEEIETNYLNIPLMVHFQTRNEHAKFYMSFGGKIGLPNKGKSKLDAVTANYTAAVVNQLNLIESGTYIIKAADKTDIDHKIAYMLSAEMGVKWLLSSKMALYTGVYADYGLNNVLENRYVGQATRLLTYHPNEAERVQAHSVMDSKFVNDIGKEELFIEKIKPMSIGLKLRLSLGIGISRRTKNATLREYLDDKYSDGAFSPDSPRFTKDPENTYEIKTRP